MTSHHYSAYITSSFKLGLLLNTGFSVFELFVGILTGSLALISDAFHNFTDSLSLLIAFFAEKLGQKKPDMRHTYGHERVTILASFLNVLLLFILAAYIFYSALKRIAHPVPVSGGAITIVALVGIGINGFIAYLFSKNKDLHMRSAFLNMAFDTLASVGALLAGIIIHITHNPIADPLISIVIGVMLIISSWDVLQEAIHILLEGVPSGMNVDEIRNKIMQIHPIRYVDDLHVWSLSSHDIALSCRIILEEQNLSNSPHIVTTVKQMLETHFHIEHATIEVELQKCENYKNDYVK